jgi:hypothetical protein
MSEVGESKEVLFVESNNLVELDEGSGRVIERPEILSLRELFS